MDKELKELIVVKGKVIEQERGYSADSGKEISYEQGAKMIKRHHDENPDDVIAHFIGRNIIEKIFSQSNCIGIRTFYGLNEMGLRSLIMVGVDSKGNNIIGFNQAKDDKTKIGPLGIVADLSIRCPPVCGGATGTTSDTGW